MRKDIKFIHPDLKYFVENLDDSWKMSFDYKEGMRVWKSVKGKELSIWRTRNGYQCAILVNGSYKDHGFKTGENHLTEEKAVEHAICLEKKYTNKID